MILTTDFDIKDKVWFIVEGNQYTHGKVTDITIDVNQDGTTTTTYTVQHNCYKPDRYRYLGLGRREMWYERRTIELRDHEVFDSKESVINQIRVIHLDKIDAIKEYKK